MKGNGNSNGKMTEEQFVLKAIDSLRKPPYTGVHTVFSGFNQAFRSYFGTDPVGATNRLAGEGKIVTRPVRRGVMIYRPEDAPTQKDKGQDALSKMGV